MTAIIVLNSRSLQDVIMNCETSEKTLKTKSFEVNFDYNISEVKYWDGIFVVLLDIPVGTNEIDNVYGVDSSGKVVWRIENAARAFSVDENAPWYNTYAQNIYVGINLSADGILVAFSHQSMKYTVDCKTGKLLDETFTK